MAWAFFGTETGRVIYSQDFRVGFGQSRIVLKFGFDPGTNVFRFYCVFWYRSNSMTNGTKNDSWP